MMFNRKNLTIAAIVSTASRFVRDERGATAIEYAMIASGVAGASSGGAVPGFSAAIASVIAEKTDSASIRGGSPTAFDR